MKREADPAKPCATALMGSVNDTSPELILQYKLGSVKGLLVSGFLDMVWARLGKLPAVRLIMMARVALMYLVGTYLFLSSSDTINFLAIPEFFKAISPTVY